MFLQNIADLLQDCTASCITLYWYFLLKFQVDWCLNKIGNICINITPRRFCATVFVVEKRCVVNSKCLSVVLVIQHALRMRYVVICGLSGSAVFFHFILKTSRYSKLFAEHKMCVLIFSTTFVCNISHSKKNWARYEQKCMLVTFILIRF